MGGNRRVPLAAIWVSALLSGGCFSAPESAVARLSEVQNDGKELHRSVEELEERLLGLQANVQLWQELARRHRQVSAIAIANQSEHLQAMLKLYTEQEEKARKRRKRRAAPQASVSSTVSSVRPKRGG